MTYTDAVKPTRLRRALLALVEAVAAGVACVASLWFCYPLHWERAGTEILAYGGIYAAGDVGGTLFLAKRAALGETGSWTRLVQAPTGLDLSVEFPNLLPTDLIGWFVQGWGLPLGYSLALLALCASNGLAVHLTARLLGATRTPALVGGVLAASVPLVADELLRGRPVSAWWAPAVLAVGLGLGALRGWGRIWLAVPAGACLWIALESYAFAPVLLGGWAVAGVLAACWGRPGTMLRALIVGPVALAMASPAIRGALAAADARRARTSTAFTTFDLPTDLAALSMPEILSTAVGSGYLERIPVAVTALGLVGALLGWRRARQWLPPLVGAVVVLAVSLGPQPDLGWWQLKPGRSVPYTAVMQTSELVRSVPRPTRWGLAGTQLLALWAAMALSQRRRRWAWAGLALGGGYLGLVQARPQQVDDTMPWPPLPGMAEIDGTDLLLDLPLLFPEDQSTYLLTAAWPIPRVNPDSGDLRQWTARLKRDEHPLLMAAAAVQQGEEVPADVLAELAIEIPEVEGLGLRRAVLHLEAGEHWPKAWLQLMDDIDAEALYWDDELVVYALDGTKR